MPKNPFLVIFALDSANLELVERWADQGYLPNLKALMAAGTLLEVGGPGAFDEIGSWTTAFSGISQNDHGYYSSRRLKAGSYELEVVSFDSAGVLPFWTDAHAAGLRSAILDPPEPFLVVGLEGVQVAELNMHFEEYAELGLRSEPPNLGAELVRKMGGNDRLRYDEFDGSHAYYADQLGKNLDRMRRRCAAFRDLLAREHHDLVVIGFGEPHDAGHMLWSFESDVGGDPACPPSIRHGVRDVYQAVDDEIGKFVERLPESSEILVVSTYGLKAQFPTAQLGEQLLERLGYRVPAAQKLKISSPLSIARKLIPQAIRERLSHRLSFATQQKLVFDNFATGTDWARTRAFNIASLYQNWIRVNLKGREPLGIVEPNDYTALLDEIEAEFRQIIDPETGESAISAALRTVSTDVEDPAHSNKPDLVVHWKARKTLLTRARHPSGDLTQSRPGFNRSSFHKFPGFLIWKGRRAPPGRRGRCGILDVAPGCMELLGLQAPDSLPGTSFVPTTRGE